MTKTIYLCGPMTGLSFNRAEEWRTKTQKKFEAIPGIQVLNPARNCHVKNDEIYQAVNLDQKRGLNCDRALRARNLSDIALSSVVFANFLDAERPSLGSIYELGYASALRVPVICVIEDSGNVHEHLMITSGIDYRFNNLPEAFSGTLTIFGGKYCY